MPDHSSVAEFQSWADVHEAPEPEVKVPSFFDRLSERGPSGLRHTGGPELGSPPRAADLHSATVLHDDWYASNLTEIPQEATPNQAPERTVVRSSVSSKPAAKILA
jgi:hypothetical protein